MAILSDRTGIAGGAPAVYLSIDNQPQAAGTTSPATGTYKESIGATVSVNAAVTLGTGYVFSNFILDGVNKGSTNPILVTMNTSHLLIAIYAVMLNAQGISVIPAVPIPGENISESSAINPTGMAAGVTDTISESSTVTAV